MGANNKETFWVSAHGYNNQGHSSGTSNIKSSIDGAHWRSLCNLHLSNVNYTAIVSQVNITGTNAWRVYGFIAPEVVTENTYRDTLGIHGNKQAIANRIRITGTNPVNFDVKILPIVALVKPCGSCYWTEQALYRPGTQY